MNVTAGQLHDVMIAVGSRITASPDSASRSVLISTIAKHTGMGWSDARGIFQFLVKKHALVQNPGMGPIFRTVYVRGEGWDDVFLAAIVEESNDVYATGRHRNVP